MKRFEMPASNFSRLFTSSVKRSSNVFFRLRPTPPPITLSKTTQARFIWGWLNSVFNRVDENRIKEVGPDRACAEWLLRCGAAVKWKDFESWSKDYNLLPSGNLTRYKIEEIDATDSAVMNIGFPHLKGLEHLRKVKFHKAFYLDDKALFDLRYVKATLEDLQVTSCGNVTDEGIKSLVQLTNLKELYIFDLPEVADLNGCFKFLQKGLAKCLIEAVSNEEMEKRKEKIEREKKKKTKQQHEGAEDKST